MVDGDLVVVYALVVLVIGVLTFLGWYAFTAISRRRQGRGSSAPPTSTGLEPDRWVELGREPGSLRYNWVTAKGRRPSSLTVEVREHTSGSFRVHTETGYDRFCKTIGLAREIQTGDPTFDYQCYVQTDALEFCTEFFADPDRREATRELLRSGFTEVAHDGERFFATWQGFPSDRAGDRSVVEEAMKLLATVSRHPPAAKPSDADRVRTRRRRRIIRQWVVLVLPIVLGISIFVKNEHPPVDSWPVIFFSLVFSIPALLVFLWIAAWLLRGHSTSHRDWLLTMWVSVFAFPVAGYSVAANLNGMLDKAPQTTHLVPVTGTSRSGSKSRSYYAIVRSWRDPADTEKLRISYAEYERIKPNLCHAVVVTGPGAFGYEWIESIQFRHEPLPAGPARANP
jgi:hypothetical protein